MALPKILQKLFANGGLGPKLNDEIIPDSVATESEILEAADKALETVTNVGNTDIADVLSAVASVEANLSSKLETSTVHVVETWSSGSRWYRKWSNGFIEQGGTSRLGTITLNTPFSNTNYSVVHETVGIQDMYRLEGSKKTTSFVLRANANETSPTYDTGWYACGY